MESGKIRIMKIDGKVNPADFLTKPKSAKKMGRLSEALNYDMPSRKNIQEDPGAGMLEIARWIEETIYRKTREEKEAKTRTLRGSG